MILLYLDIPFSLLSIIAQALDTVPYVVNLSEKVKLRE